MKRPKKILIGLLFVLSTLFCVGLSVCANYGITIFNIEQTSKTDCDENDLISDTDSYEDDQMNQALEHNSKETLFCQIPISQTYFLFDNCHFFVWQPPKNC